MSKSQIHNDTGIPLINNWIKTLFKNIYDKLKGSDGIPNFQLVEAIPEIDDYDLDFPRYPPTDTDELILIDKQ
jgi:hypothetical protein